MSSISACAEIVEEIIKECKLNSGRITGERIAKIRLRISKKYKLKDLPRLVDIMKVCPPEYHKFLVTKPVRTASGVAIVSVMCKPSRCPHVALTGGTCVYCPGGPDSDFEYSAQSYTGHEPTSMRAIRHRYDPFHQARVRLQQLKSLGHKIDKVEYIVMGGTFMSLNKRYRDNFIMGLYDALTGHFSLTLEESIQVAEQSRTKCVGITIETRPDFCLRLHISQMLGYGCTRVEIGVQSIYEDVARDTNRGHTVASVVHSFSLAKDAGYKIVTHMMPNLPNVDKVRDVEQFKEYFENPDFRSDGLKIYPTMVLRGTGLYELWKEGIYRNYTVSELVDILAKIFSMVPPWARVYRVQRDIPLPLVTSGAKHANIREMVLERMKDFKTTCRDVRTREVGIKAIHEGASPGDISFTRRDYAANGGWETFLSYEDTKSDILICLLRLRKLSSNVFRKELICDESESEEATQGVAPVKNYSSEDVRVSFDYPVRNKNASMVRELHVYGEVVSVNRKDRTDRRYQHRGFGALLMTEAERIAVEEHKSRRIAVISGVGTRNYYKKLGYEADGPYMVKRLNNIGGYRQSPTNNGL